MGVYSSDVGRCFFAGFAWVLFAAFFFRLILSVADSVSGRRSFGIFFRGFVAMPIHGGGSSFVTGAPASLTSFLPLRGGPKWLQHLLLSPVAAEGFRSLRRFLDVANAHGTPAKVALSQA